MIQDLYASKTYLAPISYCIDDDIYEYDIRKANISVLFSKGLITRSQYEYYYNLPRESRQIQIGLLQRSHPEFTKQLQAGIIEAKYNFFKENGIANDNVLAIKNDAVFLINRIPKVTKFGEIEFVYKNHYTSFYKLNNLELYYYYNFMNKEEKLDIKGLSDYSYSLHKNYFIDFLKVIFCSAQLDSIQEVLGLLYDFHHNYINRSLEIGYYREFNNFSKYRIINIQGSQYSYMMDDTISSDINYLDISFNENILKQLSIIYNSLGLSKL